ncbi:MAG TPA: DUF4837 family protein [Patescibacteria group bacterium]|nr:DUF4837 family protein [Patescibacteria group bacterium]
MKRFSLFTLCAICVFCSCGGQGSFPPAGSYSNVVLVTESGKLEGTTEGMVRVLQHSLDYYTKTEFQFVVRLISAYDLQREPPAKNVVIFGVARQGEIGRIIESFIGTASVRKVLQGNNNIFKKLNYPIEGQLTLIVTASSHDILADVIARNGQAIRDIIEEANRERLRAYLLKRERIEVTEEFRARYGFSLRIPELYEVNQERPDLPGIELVRTLPHRGLTVSWRPWKARGLSVADSSALFDARADLAWKMYDKDVMRREIVFFRDGELGEYDAVIMEGYWENSEDLFGGPFICFFVHDRVKSRLWIIDCLVYAPGFDKHVFIRELYAVAETFRIE